MAIAVGLVWWSLLLTIGTLGWLEADWIWRAVTGLFVLSSAAVTILVAVRWKTLSLIADSRTLRFGVRVVARADIAAISIGPVANTPAKFWLGVIVLALAQDLSRKVQVLSGDGRALLEISDLYGSAQLARLAAFLGVPLAGYRRLN